MMISRDDLDTTAPYDGLPDACEGDCDCCEFPTRLKKYKPGDGSRFQRERGNAMYLCELCAGSPASSAAEYPNHHSTKHVETLRTICYVGNAILAALKR